MTVQTQPHGGFRARPWRAWQTQVVDRESESYEVIILTDGLNPANPELLEAVGAGKIFCIVDAEVERLHGGPIRSYFKEHGREIHFFPLVASEATKTLVTAESFMRFCLDSGMGRRDTVLCIGGGIVCDIGALAASLVRRGAPCVKVPTTLLGMIDGAIGVKTGVNFNGMKNALGTYSVPRSVVIDLALLRTLPARQMGFGLVEMGKMLALKSRQDWELLRANFDAIVELRDMDLLYNLVRRSIRYMLDELEINLFEKDLYRIVDFGHEFGHTIEVSTGYAVSHGEAVLAGMCISNAICRHRGLMVQEDYEGFWIFAANFDLQALFGRVSRDALAESIRQTRLHKGGTFIVALHEIGRPIFLKAVTVEELDSAWRECRDRADAFASAPGKDA